jgi:hypothetical protein
MSHIAFKMRRTPEGFDGMIVVPHGVCRLPTGEAMPGPLAVKASSKSPTNALAKAANVADALASNPVLAAVMPPGTAVALKATKFLANSAAAGKLGSALKKVSGPGAARLIGAFKKIW